MATQAQRPRQAAGSAVGGQFARTHRTEGTDLEASASALHVMGVTNEQTECDRCGKLELQRTVIVHDQDGVETGRYGTSCASKVLGVKWTASGVDKIESTRRHRVVAELKRASRYLSEGDPAMAIECLADARDYGIHRPDEVRRWDEIFAAVPPETYRDRTYLIDRLHVRPAQDDRDRAEYVSVSDNTGEEYDLVPGVIDDVAEHVYKNGQCLALAIAISERTGWPVVTRTADDVGPAEFLVHTFVRTPDGALLDISGVHDPEAIELEDEESWRDWPAGQAHLALAHHGGSLVRQDLDAASAFVDPVLAMHAQDRQSTAQAAKDNAAPPDGCRFCGLLLDGHGTQQSERFGAHKFVEPAEHQREARGG